MLKKLKKLTAYILWQFQDPYFQGAAPQLAFFLFISIFPTMILLSKLLGFFSLSLEDIQAWIDIDITGAGTKALENFMTYDPSNGGNFFLIFLALWGGSRLNFSLSRITNYTFTDGEYGGHGWLRDRARSIIAMAIIIISFVVVLVLLVYTPNIMNVVFKGVAWLDFANSFWLKLRWLIVLSLYFFTISYIYVTLPHEKVPYKDIIPGTIFTAIFLLLGTVIYNSYVNHNLSNNLLYGSLSSIMALMFWLWIMSWIVIIGISLNRAWWIIRDNNPKPLNDRVIDRRVPFSIGKIRNWVHDTIHSDTPTA